jgi:hypothetical protein
MDRPDHTLIIDEDRELLLDGIDVLDIDTLASNLEKTGSLGAILKARELRRAKRAEVIAALEGFGVNTEILNDPRIKLDEDRGIIYDSRTSGDKLTVLATNAYNATIAYTFNGRGDMSIFGPGISGDWGYPMILDAEQPVQ